MTRLALLSLSLLLATAAVAQTLETSPLAIRSDETEHVFTVEIANDSEEIRRGLMDRTEMAPDAGMLFDFGEPREANMWMKDTILPLDMLFITADGQVIAIAHDTVPGSLRTINPGVSVKGVLELNAGTAARLGIEPGDIVEHPIFGNADAQ